MRCLRTLSIAATCAFPAAAFAADAPIKPVRTLVYAVTYAAHSTHQLKTSGFNAASGTDRQAGPPGVSSGNGTAGVGLDGSDTGTLTIEVIAATSDFGLVVDATYAGHLSSQTKVRVAIFADGRLSADPKNPLGSEAARILPLLARGFLTDRDVSPGSSWSVPAQPPMRGSTTYRVNAVDGREAAIALEASFTVPGVNGFDETDRGSTRYATDVISPLAYDLNARIHRQFGVDESITTDTHFTATLVSDSFAKK
jgi:hypothetical protein